MTILNYLSTMKKTIGFLFGLIAYAAFFGTILYAIGFVGNLLVPKGIDTGAESPFFQALLINSLLLGLFAVQHSLMARPAFKAWWTRIIGTTIERSMYVLLSSLTLLFLFWQWQPVATVIWKVDQPVLAGILYGIYGVGWATVFLASFMINHFELFGLKQVFENFRNKSYRESTFQTNFLYKIVRHPIMLGFLIAMWATPVMTVGHLIFSLATTGYIFIAVKYLEERDLKKIHGKTYEQYQQRVPMLIPFTKINKGTPMPQQDAANA